MMAALQYNDLFEDIPDMVLVYISLQRGNIENLHIDNYSYNLEVDNSYWQPKNSIMKKLLAICLLVMIALPAFAENKHVLRIGAGATSVNDLDYHAVYGPMLSVEYQYNFSQYAGIYSALFMTRIGIPKFSEADAYLGGAVGMMITPLPNHFRFVKFGVTFSYFNHKYVFDEGCIGYEIYNQSRVGIGFPIRAYLIDSPKYELSLGYDIMTEFREKGWVGLSRHMGCYFGVKF